MAGNTLYDKAREAFLTKQLDWTDGVAKKATLVDAATYTFVAGHQFLSDVAGGSIATPGGVAIGSRTATNGAADGADVTFTSVTAGPALEAIIIYEDTGVAGTSKLIAYIDTATGLPITPNGGDIIITWDNGTNKIFRL